MKLTKEQELVHAATRDTKDNLMINAVAGSGKTTTIVGASKYLPKGSGFLAFNKKIATELQTRLPDSVQACTFNALGHRFLTSRLPKGTRVNAYKTWDLAEKYTNFNKDDRRLVANLVSAAKSAGLGIPGFAPLDIKELTDICYHYDIMPVLDSTTTIENLVEGALEILSHNEDNFKVIDFDDQLYISLKFIIERGWKPPHFPTLMLDETQDVSMVQAHLVSRFCDRIIMVGDKFQAIYGFRGAGVDSMDDLSEFFIPNQLDLTYTFRCGEKMVALAQKINPRIRARPNAPEGIVTYSRTDKEITNYVEAGDMVICRNNFPLIKVALTLLLEKKAFNMSGNFPTQLMAFTKAFNADHIQMFRTRLKDWWETISEELEKQKKFGVLERESDKFQSLWALQSECESMDILYEKLAYMITNKSGVSLATIHSSKGLEASVVHFLRPDLLPSKHATQVWQLQQEDNLYYVGVTRAIDELHFYGEG